MNRIEPIWETKAEQAKDIWKIYNSLIKKVELREKLNVYKDEIIDESNELGNFLFEGGVLCEDRLNHLLTTRTDRETLEKEHLVFHLSKGKERWEYTPVVFDYQRFSNFSDFKRLVKLLGVETCPYCNRTFTSTVRTKNGHHRQNQVDHYMNKKNYPYLALTLPNLIPVCGDCNLHKSCKNEDVLYPYKESYEDNYRFVTHPIKGYGYLVGESVSDESFSVIVEKAQGKELQPEYVERVENEISQLDINELYSVHNTYVASIFRQRFIFGEEYIEDVYNSFKDLFIEISEVRQMLYMKSIEDNELSLSPLSRLTRDIDFEITRLSKKEPDL